MDSSLFYNPITPTYQFSSIQNNECKSPLKLLSVERVKIELKVAVEMKLFQII